MKFLFVSLTVATLSILLLKYLFSVERPEVAGLSLEELVQKYGYPVETHEVVTKDGYILTLHRIPFGKGAKKRGPVLICHGFLLSAFTFVHSGPNISLGFLLADQGYDVWLGNARGNSFSRKHVKLDPDIDAEFWDFTVHEIGTYDLPACIDYILERTNQESLHYVGYSQGTTSFFIMGSEKPEYLRKIKLMTALSPAFYLDNPKSPVLSFLAPRWESAQNVLSFLKLSEFGGKGTFLTNFYQAICNKDSIFVNLCLYQIFILFGDDYEGTSQDFLTLEFAHNPAGSSSKQLILYLQWIKSGNCCRYDYGIEGNIAKYHQEEPPCYDLSKVTTPVAAYYCGNDWAVDIKNSERLVQTLPNVVKNYKVPWEKFNHYDFILGKETVDLLYNPVIEEMSKH